MENSAGALIFCGIVLLIALCCFGCCISQADWRSAKTRAHNSSSKIAMTQFGEVEYSIMGSGPCLVFCHGTPGSHDGVSRYADDWVNADFTVITPSRGGYGRSKLLQNFEEQADAIASLLDSLEIKECAIGGVSGGGPTALQFALRHPNKCKAVYTECAVTGGFTHPKEAEFA